MPPVNHVPPSSILTTEIVYVKSRFFRVQVSPTEKLGASADCAYTSDAAEHSSVIKRKEAILRGLVRVSLDKLAQRARLAAWAPGMTLRAKGARKRRGNSPRPKEEGTIKVCPEAGRERRLMHGHLGAPARAAVHRERRAPAAGSRAFIKDAGRRFAAIPPFDQAMLTLRPVAPVRLIRAVPRRLAKGVPWRSGLSESMWRCMSTVLPSSTVMVKRSARASPSPRAQTEWPRCCGR